MITREKLIELTNDHSYYHVARKILHVSDNTLNKLLKEHNIEKRPRYLRRSYPSISQECKEFMLGSLMGDASIVKQGPQYRFTVTHCPKQKEYLIHKKELLGELAQSDIHTTKHKAHEIPVFIRGKFENRVIKDSISHIIHSKVHPYFAELREKMYNNKRKFVSKWHLDQLTSRSLAYWIMDDGSADFCDNSYVINISTYCFTYEEHELIKKFFFDKFNVEMQLQPIKRGYGWTTRFRTIDSKKIRDIIKPFIPSCMKYKICRKEWLKWSSGK